jgi:hypothetical protein
VHIDHQGHCQGPPPQPGARQVDPSRVQAFGAPMVRGGVHEFPGGHPTCEAVPRHHQGRGGRSRAGPSLCSGGGFRGRRLYILARFSGTRVGREVRRKDRTEEEATYGLWEDPEKGSHVGVFKPPGGAAAEKRCPLCLQGGARGCSGSVFAYFFSSRRSGPPKTTTDEVGEPKRVPFQNS